MEERHRLRATFDNKAASYADARPTYHADVEIALEDGKRPLHRGERLHVHHGTRESPARVYPLEGW